MAVQYMPFRVTALHGSVPDGIPIEWMGKELPSGPLMIELREGLGVGDSRGEFDYARRQTHADFHVHVEMPELRDLLQTLGVNAGLLKPVYAVVRSAGAILEDHSFNLTGLCVMEPHKLFDGTQAGMLPGH
jgi:hypothetical protein